MEGREVSDRRTDELMKEMRDETPIAIGGAMRKETEDGQPVTDGEL